MTTVTFEPDEPELPSPPLDYDAIDENGDVDGQFRGFFGDGFFEEDTLH